MDNVCGMKYRVLNEWMDMMREPLRAKLERKLMFSTGWEDLNFEQLQTRIQVLAKDPARVMDQIHNAVGGELWIDGVLCYKNGQRLKEPFKFYVPESMSPRYIPAWANPDYQRG